MLPCFSTMMNTINKCIYQLFPLLVAGVLRDQLGSYKYAFYGSGTLFLFTVIGYEIYTLRRVCRHRDESPEKDATATVTWTMTSQRGKLTQTSQAAVPIRAAAPHGDHPGANYREAAEPWERLLYCDGTTTCLVRSTRMCNDMVRITRDLHCFNVSMMWGKQNMIPARVKMGWWT